MELTTVKRLRKGIAVKYQGNTVFYQGRNYDLVYISETPESEAWAVNHTEISTISLATSN